MKYTYRWSDGRALSARSDANTPLNVYNSEIEAENDTDALAQIIKTICGHEPRYDDIDDLYSVLDNIDVGSGTMFIFWIRREDDTQIYSSSIDESDYTNIHRLEEWCDMFLKTLETNQ